MFLHFPGLDVLMTEEITEESVKLWLFSNGLNNLQKSYFFVWELNSRNI